MTTFPKPEKRKRVKGRTSKHRARRKAKLRDADKLFSLFIRNRDGWACRKCGSVQNIQCAHIVSRRYRATRWSPDNAIALCARDHVKFTYRPLEWEAWIDERFPGRLEALKLRALAGVAHVDYEAVCKMYEADKGGSE